MYHALLTNRYLTSRVIPLIAVAAVALCVALVIIVVSVMTGFLNMVRSSGRTLMGDVVVSYPVSGIPHYERLIRRIEDLPQAAAATPVVDSWGLLRMPYPDGPHKETNTVQIWGVEPASFDRVTGYAQTLHWRELNDEQRDWLFADLLERHGEELMAMLNEQQQLDLLRLLLDSEQPGLFESYPLETHRQKLAEFRAQGWEPLTWGLRWSRDQLPDVLGQDTWRRWLALEPRLAEPDRILTDGIQLRRAGAQHPGIATGMHVSAGNERQSDGTYQPARSGYWWMPRFDVTLTTLPVDASGGLRDPESVVLSVVNEFMSGVYLIDEKRVMVPLDVAQALLHLDQAEHLDENGQVDGIIPPKATMVLVRAADGVTPEALRDAVASAYDAFTLEMMNDEQAVVKPPASGYGLTILTWEQQQARFIGPIEKERALMRTLFSLVYLVCAGLVLAIFWAIVYEKTRDIGILRSIGASRLGISWIFLRYGLVVGVLGAIVGLGLAALIVHNINTIHDLMGHPPRWIAFTLFALTALAAAGTVVRARTGRMLPIVLGSLIVITLCGLGLVAYFMKVVIWDQSVYYFSTIPNDLDWMNVATSMTGAVLFSLIGAFLPAAKAADTDPVRALRYE